MALRGRQKKHIRDRANKWLTWDRHCHLTPYRADVPAGAVPPITRAINKCLVITLSDQRTQRWAFTKRSHRDQFVAAFKHLGAANTRY